MNRLEALKAMLEGKKVGHPKLLNDVYYVLENSTNPIRLKAREDDNSMVTNMSHDDGYYIIKNKVKKYKVLFIAKDAILDAYPNYQVSGAYYKSLEDFHKNMRNSLGLQILEATMIEVEEE